MMYQERLAVAIKTNGRILREFKETVVLPFGSEYSILIKNLNTLRAVVRIEIDGQNVTDSGLIVAANSSVDLERFLSGNLNAGNRFKFIERTSSIEQHRGIGVEDGLVRVEFEFEQKIDYQKQIISPWPGSASSQFLNVTNTGGGVLRGGLNTTTWSSVGSPGVASASALNSNDLGITVPGSISSQKFISVHNFCSSGIKHVMVLKLSGESGGQPAEQPITVKSKQKCSTCGHNNKMTSKFCTECGTSLQYV